MSDHLRIYLDCCCYNRPFDDLSEARAAFESEAVLRIIRRAEVGRWNLVTSDAVLYEIRRMPDFQRREACLAMCGLAKSHIYTSEEVRKIAARLSAAGFAPLDAAHLAFATAGDADLFLTVDDRLLRKARATGIMDPVVVANPADWLLGESGG